MKKKIEQKLKELLEVNKAMKLGAKMVGFDVDGETEKVLAGLDGHVRINIWQQHFIKVLKILLEKEE